MSNSTTFLPLPVRMAGVVLGLGTIFLVGLTCLEYHRAVEHERLSIQRFVARAGDAVANRNAIPELPQATAVAQRLRSLQGAQGVSAWRILDQRNGDALVHGHRPIPPVDRLTQEDSIIWSPSSGRLETLEQAAFNHRLIVRIPFDATTEQGKILEAVIDGPARHRQAVQRIAFRLLPVAGILAIVGLAVALCTRRWVTQPLASLPALAELNHRPNSIGEPRTTVQAVRTLQKQMQGRIDEAHHGYRVAQNLADSASKALLNLDAKGTITAANLAASRLLDPTQQRPVVGESIHDFLQAAEQSKINQSLADASQHPNQTVSQRVRLRDDQAVHATLRTDAQTTEQTTLTLEPRNLNDALQDRLARQQALLQTAIDRLDRPWLLTDAAGRIVAHNHAWASRLHRSADALVQADITQPDVWLHLGQDTATDIAKAITRGLEHGTTAFQHQVDTLSTDRFVLHAQPLASATHASPNPSQNQNHGIAWTLEEPNLQTVNPTPAHAQPANDPFNALASDLREARTSQDLLEATVQAARAYTRADAAGVAVRSNDPLNRKRSDQRVAHGPDERPLPLTSFAQLRDAVEAELMPDTMSAGQPTSARDADDGPWGQALRTCGLNAHAATKLDGVGEELGVLWIAQRSGRPLPDHATQALRRIADLVASRFEALRVAETFCDLGMLDHNTGLPTTPTLLRHLQNPNRISNHQTPTQLIVFSTHAPVAPDSPAAVAYAQACADRLRARCRRSVFIAATGPLEFAVAVHDLAPQHAQGLGERLATTLNQIQTPNGQPIQPWRFGMHACPQATPPADATAVAEQVLAQARRAAQPPPAVRQAS